MKSPSSRRSWTKAENAWFSRRLFSTRAPLARERRVAVLLPPLLDLEVGAHADLGLAAQAEERKRRPQARLDPEVVVVAQPPLVAAGGEQVRHAAAGGVARSFGRWPELLDWRHQSRLKREP